MFWIFWKHFIGSNIAGTASSLRDRSDDSYSPKITRPSSRISDSDLFTAFSSFGSDVYCIIDNSVHFLYLSDNWQAVTGKLIQESLESGIKKRIHPLHLNTVIEYLADADNKAPAVRFQLNLGNHDWRWFELQLATATRKESGEVHYTCLLRDINDLVNIQDKYEKYRLEADLANRSRSEFLANMNHELRTPLNAIIGFAQMMENGVYGDIGHPKYTDYINNIQSSGLTLLSKVNDLIDIANIDSDRMVLNEAPTDLVALIRQAIELQSHRAFDEQITLRENLPLEPLMVVMDRIRMLQVLVNIISNAVKYSNAGGVVDVYCEKRKDGGINIIVEDNGSGISASHLQRILSAFSQDNSFFARSRHCSGIGLALSKEIVKLHQGKIDIKSEAGKGTLLKIVLPAERNVKKVATQKATPLDCLID